MDFADYFRHMALMDQQPSIGQMVQMMGANTLEQKLRQRKATLREAKNAPGRAALLARLCLKVGALTATARSAPLSATLNGTLRRG